MYVYIHGGKNLTVNEIFSNDNEAGSPATWQQFVNSHQKRKIGPTGLEIDIAKSGDDAVLLPDRIQSVWGPLETTKVIPFGEKRLDDAFIARNGGSADPWLSPVTKESKSWLVNWRGRPGIGSICSRATPRGGRLRNGPDNEIHKIHRFSRIISFLLLLLCYLEIFYSNRDLIHFYARKSDFSNDEKWIVDLFVRHIDSL